MKCKKETERDTLSLMEKGCLDGWTKAHCAAYDGNYDLLLNELNSGFDVNKTSRMISYGGYKKNSLFYNKKMKVHFEDVTLLYLASQEGHADCVQLLIDRGADIKIKIKSDYNKKGSTALNNAFYNNNFKSISIMKKGVNKQNTLLFNEYTKTSKSI